jgi:hypothetical protein
LNSHTMGIAQTARAASAHVERSARRAATRSPYAAGRRTPVAATARRLLEQENSTRRTGTCVEPRAAVRHPRGLSAGAEAKCTVPRRC